jgi:hypothetical protein
MFEAKTLFTHYFSTKTRKFATPTLQTRKQSAWESVGVAVECRTTLVVEFKKRKNLQRFC